MNSDNNAWMKTLGLPTSFFTTSNIMNAFKAKSKSKKRKKNKKPKEATNESILKVYFNSFQIKDIPKEASFTILEFNENPDCIHNPNDENYKDDNSFPLSLSSCENGNQNENDDNNDDENENDKDNDINNDNEITRKYWHHRYDLFSLYDQGIQLDVESWYSVTPELIAKHIAQQIPSGMRILDLFCGAGGDAIQFALIKENLVTAIDIDSDRIELAKNNGLVYGITSRLSCFNSSKSFSHSTSTIDHDNIKIDKKKQKEIERKKDIKTENDNKNNENLINNNIQWIIGDVLKLHNKRKRSKILGFENEFDVVFASPPWGGPNYKSKSKFDLKRDLPLDFVKIIKIAISISPNVIIYLPRNTDIGTIRNILYKQKLSEFIIEQYWMRNKCKAICLYIGSLFSPPLR